MAITLTERAAERIKSFLVARGKGIGLRVGVKTTGCSGFAYIVDFTDELRETDKIYEDRGVKIVIDDKSLPFLNGSEIDFRREGLGEAFKFNNPNVKDTCGCGESFNI